MNDQDKEKLATVLKAAVNPDITRDLLDKAVAFLGQHYEQEDSEVRHFVQYTSQIRVFPEVDSWIELGHHLSGTTPDDKAMAKFGPKNYVWSVEED